MIPILTPEEAAALDRASADRGISVESLMERAGFALGGAAAALAGRTYGLRVAVVCGKGNNGGDGFVAGRYLASKGAAVTALLAAPAAEVRGAAATNLHRLMRMGARVVAASEATARREVGRADICVDALFGTGFRGPATGLPAAAIEAMRGFEGPVVAADIPSGVEGASGAVTGPAVAATVTVTFGALKPGVAFLPGATLAGRVEVADIGFPEDLLTSDLWMVESADAARLLAVRTQDANKRSTGVVLVVAGSRSMPGAAVLATRAAYRAGAGLVTLAAVPAASAVAQQAVVEAIHVPLPETDAGGIAEAAWPSLEERLGSVHAVAIGPGLGREDETAALIRRVVAESPVPVVVDADALNAFPGGAGLDRRRAAAVLTPHAGEFARLTGVGVEEVAADRVGHVRKAASAFDAIVLLKGPRTVVATPDGRAFVEPTGGPALATGGTGDVLTGAVGAWLARGVDPVDAAVGAAYVHGLAGDMAGTDLGEGTTAEDVAERLPAAVLAVREGVGLGLGGGLGRPGRKVTLPMGVGR